MYIRRVLVTTRYVTFDETLLPLTSDKNIDHEEMYDIKYDEPQPNGMRFMLYTMERFERHMTEAEEDRRGSKDNGKAAETLALDMIEGHPPIKKGQAGSTIDLETTSRCYLKCQRDALQRFTISQFCQTKTDHEPSSKEAPMGFNEKNCF